MVGISRCQPHIQRRSPGAIPISLSVAEDRRPQYAAPHELTQTVDWTRPADTHDLLTAFSNGTSALLLHLAGTIPVVFRGTTYRFPISLWVPHAYPREAPFVYVTPTETMVVRPGQHVDPQGQVYHPYLVGWADFWDVCRPAHQRTRGTMADQECAEIKYPRLSRHTTRHLCKRAPCYCQRAGPTTSFSPAACRADPSSCASTAARVIRETTKLRTIDTCAERATTSSASASKTKPANSPTGRWRPSAASSAARNGSTAKSVWRRGRVTTTTTSSSSTASPEPSHVKI